VTVAPNLKAMRHRIHKVVDAYSCLTNSDGFLSVIGRKDADAIANAIRHLEELYYKLRALQHTRRRA